MIAHSIWILEYGFVDRFPASNLFAAQPNEGHRRMPYCFALLRTGDRFALVDTGFADEAISHRLTTKYGHTYWISPVEALDRVGVRPEQIGTVVLTHHHFDHAGGVHLFPDAHVYVQAREIDYFVAARARPPRFEFLTRSAQADLPEQMARRLAAGTGTLVDGEADVHSGLSVRPAFDTHTAGSQLAVVHNDTDGDWVFAGDTVYAYENLDGLRGDGVLAPIAMSNGSATRWLDFADEMLDSVGRDSRRILPFHEARIWESFPSREFADGLHVAEVSLAGGHPSLV